ncbi:hypothetical protein NFI96_027256 [Prochilodus magdalenae]|nr:hypothetical protein NFI96_027256 [Prochilodus magdalenae]
MDSKKLNEPGRCEDAHLMEGIGPVTIAAVISGVSLLVDVDTISQNIGTSKKVTIEISNKSDTYILTNPRIHTLNGYCHLPPKPTINNNTKEACSFSKTGYSTFGVEGVLMYKILQNESDHVAELAIMFSVPYTYIGFRNWFAFGLYESNTPCDENLLKQMYEGSGPFNRGEGTGSTITYSDKGVAVKGTMSSSGHSIIKIEIMHK